MPRTFLVSLALLLPVLMAVACALWVRRRRTVGARLGERRLVGRMTGHDLHAVPWRRIAPILLASVLCGLTLAFFSAAHGAAAHVGSRDIVLVLDASNSMRVEDVAPNRLEQQRLLARRMLRELADDRVGVVVFAGQASVLTPPTRDHAAVEMFIDAVRPEIAVQTGTAIGAGLRQASSLLAASPQGRGARLAVLVSDGEPLDPDVERDAGIAAARRAASLGVVVHTIAIGTERGGPVPDIDPNTGRRLGFKTDPFTGQTAVSALDAPMLREIARQTRGSFHHLSDAAALAAALDAVRGADPADSAPPGDDPLRPAMWLIAGALLLIAGDAVAERRRERRIA